MGSARLVASGLGAVLGLVLTLAQGACGGGDAGVGCSPGQTLRCSCNGSLTGQTTCDSSGREGICDCSGATGSSSGGGGSSSSGSGSSGGGSGSGSGSGSSSGGDEAGIGGEGGPQTDGPTGEGSSSGAEAGGGTTPFGQACTTSSECQTNDCQNFPGLGGDYCTLPCSLDSQCPTPPGLGCNGMGYCKVP